MSTIQDEVVKLYRWYQAPTDYIGEKIQLEEEFLRYHRLDTIYVTYCRNKGMPELLSQFILDRQKKASMKYSIYKNIKCELSARLQQGNIKHVFLKGVMLAEDIYTEPWHRYYSDLDLLVDKDNLAAVEKILFDMGYQYGYYAERTNTIHYPTRAQILYQRTYTHEMHKMFRMETATLASHIDVNFLFMWRGIRKQGKTYSVKDFTDHIVHSQGVPVFDRVVNLIHLCCHLYNEAMFFALDREYEGGDPREIVLIRVFDIALLVKHISTEEIVELVSLSKQLNCIDKVAFSIGVTNVLLNLDIGQGFDELHIESEDEYAGYYGTDQKYHKWPISLHERVFDIQQKRELSDILFPTHTI